LLFAIVMEALCITLSATVSEGFLFGFFVGNGSGIDFSHLLFDDDDTLIFCGAIADHLCHLRCLVLFLKLFQP
jgi:hypothetical protein